MVVAGAGGHAKDLVLAISTVQSQTIVFFDDITYPQPSKVLDFFNVITSLEEVEVHFRRDPDFVIGIGGTKVRKQIGDKLVGVGGNLCSIIANNALIGGHKISLGEGLNIMPFVQISNSVTIGTGCLINSRVSIHHDVFIDEFCELSPGGILLGGVSVGAFTSVGAGAIVLPNIVIGRNCIIGAGAVVTKDVSDNCFVAGVPAKIVGMTDNV